MSENRKKSVKGTTPVGSAAWFKLAKPDQKFKKYTVDIIVEDTEQIRTLIEQGKALAEHALAEEKKKVTEKKNAFEASKIKLSEKFPIEEQRDGDGNPTGKFVIKVRGKSEGINKDKEVYQIAAPMLIKPNGQPYSRSEAEALRVPNGSLIQLGFELQTYCNASLGAGITIKPIACKIIKLQSTVDASMFAFSAGEMESTDASDSEEDFSAEAPSNQGASDGQDF